MELVWERGREKARGRRSLLKYEAYKLAVRSAPASWRVFCPAHQLAGFFYPCIKKLSAAQQGIKGTVAVKLEII
jgi:hypothetical protein